MLRLRKILLCDYLYLSIILVIAIITIIRLSIPIRSNYNKQSNSFIGIIQKITIKEDKVTVYIKNKETVIGTYYLNKLNYSNLKLGDKVIVTGVFKLPSNNTSEYLFNYRKYLQRKKIYYLIEIDSLKKIKNNRNIYFFLKQKLIDSLNNNAYLYTFIIGDKSYLDSNIKRSYQSLGISHLFCISGMHITLLITIINKILKRFKLNEEKMFLISTNILIIYLFLVGLAPSILRAVLFYIFFSLNSIYYFYIKPTNLFLLIVSFSLLINPNYIYDIGYLYSYSISFALIKTSNQLLNDNYFKTIFKTSIISLLVSLPITLYNFYEINILSIIYNLIFIPLVSIIIFPLSLLVIIIKPLLPVYNLLTNVLETLALYLNNISFGKLIFPRLSIVIYIVYFLLIMIYLHKPKKVFLYSFFILLIIHYLIPYFNYSKYVEVLDVGQGDSILIHYKSKNILLDTGGTDNKGIIYFNTIGPILKSKGIRKLNFLITSHGDNDHMGEAITIVNNFKVDKVIFNCGTYNYLEKELINVLDKKEIKYYSCIKELNIDNNKLYFLQTKEYDNENYNSNVIYTEINGYKFMFMGDASIVTEEEILKKYDLPEIDVLKVGHHGSRTSSSKEFINTIKPKYALISVGKNNKFKHPNKEALDNLIQSKIYRTDKQGSIMIKTKNNKLKIRPCQS